MNSNGRITAQGLTILELMVTVSVMVILVTVAIPNMLRFVANTQQVTQVNNLIADIVYARNEAATRGMKVSICVSQNVATASPTCAALGTTAWQTGRIIFVDANGDGVMNTANNDILLQKTPALPTDSTLTATGFTNTSHITMGTFGGLTPSTAGSFKACSTTSASGYSIAVPATGQPLSTKVNCP